MFDASLMCAVQADPRQNHTADPRQIHGRSKVKPKVTRGDKHTKGEKIFYPLIGDVFGVLVDTLIL